MDYELSISESHRYVICRINRPITADFALDFAKAADEFALERGVNKVLYDMRSIRNMESTMRMHDLAYRDVAEMGIRRNVRSAVLIDPEDHSHDFAETVFFNAGYGMRLFRTEEEALNWLDV